MTDVQDSSTVVSNSVQLQLGYHVTNVPASEDTPLWPKLKPTLALDKYYDGDACGLLLVYISTTLRGGELPTHSVYPTRGKPSTHYYRLVVDLSRFNRYELFFDRRNEGQALFILVDPEENPVAFQIFKRAFHHCPNGIPGLLERKLLDNGQYEWTGNDYDDVNKNGGKGGKVFVNVGVFGNFPINLKGTYPDHWTTSTLQRKCRHESTQNRMWHPQDLCLHLWQTVSAKGHAQKALQSYRNFAQSGSKSDADAENDRDFESFSDEFDTATEENDDDNGDDSDDDDAEYDDGANDNDKHLGFRGLVSTDGVEQVRPITKSHHRSDESMMKRIGRLDETQLKCFILKLWFLQYL